MRKPKNRAVEHRTVPAIHGKMTLTQTGDREMTITFDTPCIIKGPLLYHAFGVGLPHLPSSQEPATGKTNNIILQYDEDCDFALGIRIIPGDPNLRTIYGGFVFPEYGPCS